MATNKLISSLTNRLLPLLRSAVASKERSVALFGVVFGVLYVVRAYQTPKTKSASRASNKANVDLAFLSKIMKLLPVVIPSAACKEVGLLALLSVALVLRTFLSIWIAGVNGKIVRSIVAINLKDFIKSVLPM